jgi:hypothetical protein
MSRFKKSKHKTLKPTSALTFHCSLSPFKPLHNTWETCLCIVHVVFVVCCIQNNSCDFLSCYGVLLSSLVHSLVRLLCEHVFSFLNDEAMPSRDSTRCAFSLIQIGPVTAQLRALWRRPQFTAVFTRAGHLLNTMYPT